MIFTLTDVVIDDWEFSMERFLWRLVVTVAHEGVGLLEKREGSDWGEGEDKAI